MSMNFRRKLPVPKEIKELYPLNDKIKAIKTERDAMIADVFTGKSDKFLLIIGAGQGQDHYYPENLHQQAQNHRRGLQGNDPPARPHQGRGYA